MEPVEAAWLAGLFDGEGSIIFPNHRKRNVRIDITNTHLPLLQHVKSVTGTGQLIHWTPRNPKHSERWNWQVYNHKAVLLLQQMLPWLIGKHERATESIALYTTT